MTLTRRFTVLRTGLFSCPVCSKERSLVRTEVITLRDLYQCYNCGTHFEKCTELRGTYWQECRPEKAA
jgi:transcription elongation factor Elf1